MGSVRLPGTTLDSDYFYKENSNLSERKLGLLIASNTYTTFEINCNTDVLCYLAIARVGRL